MIEKSLLSMGSFDATTDLNNALGNYDQFEEEEQLSNGVAVSFLIR